MGQCVTNKTSLAVSRDATGVARSIKGRVNAFFHPLIGDEEITVSHLSLDRATRTKRCDVDVGEMEEVDG
jgi:hypothetical protein